MPSRIRVRATCQLPVAAIHTTASTAPATADSTAACMAGMMPSHVDAAAKNFTSPAPMSRSRWNGSQSTRADAQPAERPLGAGRPRPGAKGIRNPHIVRCRQRLRSGCGASAGP